MVAAVAEVVEDSTLFAGAGTAAAAVTVGLHKQTPSAGEQIPPAAAGTDCTLQTELKIESKTS